MNESIEKFLNDEVYILAYRSNYDRAGKVNQELIDYIKNLQQENKILRENAEHNDKVVDKYWWENKYLKQENEQLHHKRFEILNFIEENKNKRYAPYGDNEDEDFEICLNEDEIDVLERIVRDEYDYES